MVSGHDNSSPESSERLSCFSVSAVADSPERVLKEVTTLFELLPTSLHKYSWAVQISTGIGRPIKGWIFHGLRSSYRVPEPKYRHAGDYTSISHVAPLSRRNCATALCPFFSADTSAFSYTPPLVLTSAPASSNIFTNSNRPYRAAPWRAVP